MEKRWKKDGKHKKTSKKQKNTYKNLQITQKRWKKNGNTQWKKINKKTQHKPKHKQNTMSI